MGKEVTETDKKLAQHCVNCKICRYARKRQKGIIYSLIKIGEKFCPFCRAYEKVYGKKAYDTEQGNSE
ncbi:hypothetical protein L21SP3_00440 [Sedimentisphaera cyanobacteriorum]|uniref:Uncharacterized protein n=1 Tax=Sedimentisphaera cyanobacteriorum TaxID=1940790 RepID=A0A1Q2HMY2_9BACT|nr:hypothetical protein [Sedimentisphaera cyanobacteriorum]AQQ08651.1 hypothetical protein L21SP3_00440 [Sedimentisphaera cyanobacteriorum]